jgi:hypothetical protein
MQWKDHIALLRIRGNADISSKSNIFNYTTKGWALPTLSRNEIHDVDFNENEESDNESKNDESFSSFISSSIGSNISKSVDWALETTTMHPCQNPFEYYCHPVTSPAKSKKAETEILPREQMEESSLDERHDDDESDDEEKEALCKFVPFTFTPFCEYCGSPSIRNCRNFDPQCQRPETFFPKAKPPFYRSKLPSPL